MKKIASNNELYLVKLSNKEINEVKDAGFFRDVLDKRIGRYALMLIGEDDYSYILVCGLDMNDIKEAMHSFNKFMSRYSKDYGALLFDSYYYFYYPKTNRLTTVEPKKSYKQKKVGTNYSIQEKPKEPKEPEYYAVIPKSRDGITKVMDIKPPAFLKQYGTIEGPFKSKKAVTWKLDELKIPNPRRPKDYWHLDGY